MAGDSKIIYLIKDDGVRIKLYVVDYLKDKETQKEYVLVSDQAGNNVKGFELVGDRAFVLSADEGKKFQNYTTNRKFLNITSVFLDEMVYKLTLKTKKEEKPKFVTYYVLDRGVLCQYTAELKKDKKDGTMFFANTHFQRMWENVKKEDVDDIIKKQNHDKPVYVVYDKMNDLKFVTAGKVIPLNCKKVDPKKIGKKIAGDSEDKKINEQKVDSKKMTFTEEKKEAPAIQEPQAVVKPVVSKAAPEIIFYVYDEDVVIKYQGQLENKTGERLEVSNIKVVDSITGARNLDVTQFMDGDNFEVGAYFVEYEDYKSSIDKTTGMPTVRATIEHSLMKEKQVDAASKKEEKAAEPSPVIYKKEEKLEKEKIVVFTGEIASYGGKKHYKIYGSVCTVLSKNPLTLLPEKNGVKTIEFEDPNMRATSLNETCQIYQNLYPTLPVYLLKEYEINNGEKHILNDYNYVSFTPQANLHSGSLLEIGKKVLTEEEMLARREEELKILKKKQRSLKSSTPVAEEYLRANPDDISFASYIRTLELAGMTREHMRATGLLDQIEKRKENEEKVSETFTNSDILISTPNFNHLASSSGNIQGIRLSESFRKHFPVVKGVNDDILNQIEKMERFGHSPKQIIDELHLPSAMVEEFKKDIPYLDGIILEPQNIKKAM